ncbi:hypothetical protein ACSBR1_016999 [Camellia fascicularis]
MAIAEPLGLAAVKAIVAITAIIAGGRLPLRPIYKQVAENQNAEIFSANTLLVILGTSLLTARAGLSMTLGAFLAGLLLAETNSLLRYLWLTAIVLWVSGRLFGISITSAIRVGLLLALGGEFAFVAFGEAVNQLIGRKYLKVDTQDSRGTVIGKCLDRKKITCVDLGSGHNPLPHLMLRHELVINRWMQ